MTATQARAAGAGGVTAPGVVRSEWLKLVTVRSTFWTTATALALAAVVALLVGAAVPTNLAAGPGGVALATASLGFVDLVVGVLGVLAIGGEYATLQIRSSYTAVPHRWPALVAKAAVVGAWSFVLGLIVTFGGFGIVAGLLGGRGGSVTFDGGTAGALVGGAVYLAVIGVFAVGLGALLRSSAAGISILTALLFVAPIVLAVIGGLTRADWVASAGDYLLSAAGGVLFTPGDPVIPIWAALIALACWLAVVWVPAILLTQTRDV